MYKVFINDSPLFLLEEAERYHHITIDPEIPEQSGDPKKILRDMINGKYPKGVKVYDTDVEFLFESAFEGFKLIEAAGGLVENTETGEYLFIFRNGKWDLPKGKLEKGEGVEEGAIREVEEECGIVGLSILQPLNPTFHIYEHKGSWVLKRTWWFLMLGDADAELVPQEEEGITRVEWRSREELKDILANTYGSITDVILDGIGE